MSEIDFIFANKQPSSEFKIQQAKKDSVLKPEASTINGVRKKKKNAKEPIDNPTESVENQVEIVEFKESIDSQSSDKAPSKRHDDGFADSRGTLNRSIWNAIQHHQVEAF